MRGLLRKDGYMTLRYGKFFLAFILIYAGIAALSDMGMLFSLINVMIGGMLVKTLLSYEEQSRWDGMAVYLPVTAGTIAAVCGLAGRETILPFGTHTLFLMGAGTLWLALELPVLFKFGVNRGRTWFTLLTVLIAGLMGGAGAASAGRFEGMERTGSHPAALTAVMAVFLAAALILTAFSARLSVRFYRKREF